MNSIQIYSAKNEMEAMIVKGYLENAGIKNISVASGNNSVSAKTGLRGPNVTHYVYVREDESEEAKKILLERDTDTASK